MVSKGFEEFETAGTFPGQQEDAPPGIQFLSPFVQDDGKGFLVAAFRGQALGNSVQEHELFILFQKILGGVLHSAPGRGLLQELGSEEPPHLLEAGASVDGHGAEGTEEIFRAVETCLPGKGCHMLPVLFRDPLDEGVPRHDGAKVNPVLVPQGDGDQSQAGMAEVEPGTAGCDDIPDQEFRRLPAPAVPLRGGFELDTEGALPHDHVRDLRAGGEIGKPQACGPGEAAEKHFQLLPGERQVRPGHPFQSPPREPLTAGRVR